MPTADLGSHSVINLPAAMSPTAVFSEWQMLQQQFPHMATGQAELNDVIDPTSLVPKGFQVTRSMCSEHWSAMSLVSYEYDVAVLIECHFKSEMTVGVAAVTASLAVEVRDQITGAVPTPEPKDDVVGIQLWYLAVDGPDYTHKRILVPAWQDIARNYPGRAHDPLAELMAHSCPDEENPPRLILWHGPPGTGKTWAVRALARQWKDWCTMHYIADPEKIFANPGYLLSVAGDAGAPKWRLIVAEDADEFLRAEARDQAGAALGRLLNFTDGIMGQGSKTLFLLTTNVPVGTLHPAVQRPGRCLAQIQFDPFTPAQAREWAGGGHFAEDLTLAELVERQRSPDHHQIRTGLATAGAGTYL